MHTKRTTLEERACLQCGTPFQPRLDRARYCGRPCFDEAQRTPRIERPCGHCGTTMHVLPTRIADRRGSYCSRSCAGAARRDPISQRICEQCGVHFKKQPDKVRLHGGRFCSRRCEATAKTRDVATEIAARVGPIEPNGCQLWQGARNRHGYGRIRCDKSQRTSELATRIIWERLAGAPIPEGFDVLHVCDNPPCVRHDDPGIYVVRDIVRPRFGHLWLGTAADNMADMAIKHRGNFGEKNPNAVLTDADIPVIRAMHATMSMRAIARHYGVNGETIRRIIHGKYWRHIG